MAFKVVTCADKPKENAAFPLSSTERFSIFQLIVLVLWPAALLFWFTFTSPLTPVNLISSLRWQLIAVEKTHSGTFSC